MKTRLRKILNRMAYWYLLANSKLWREEPPPEDAEVVNKKIDYLKQQGKPITTTSMKETKLPKGF